MKFPRNSRNRLRSGFTLTELLLAMLVFAIAITTILALLARSIETVDEVLLKDEAMRLSGAVEDFFENQPFNVSYSRSLAVANGAIQTVAFNYRALPDQSHGDGTLLPYTSLGGVLGEDFVLTPFVRYKYANDAANSVLLSAIQGLDGRLFLVKLTISPNNPIEEPLPNNPDNYSSAVLVLIAEYYPVSSLEQAALPPAEFEDLGIAPVYSYTFAIRR